MHHSVRGSLAFQQDYHTERSRILICVHVNKTDMAYSPLNLLSKHEQIRVASP